MQELTRTQSNMVLDPVSGAKVSDQIGILSKNAISVLSYSGIDSTGTTDCTIAIQNAISDAISKGFRKVIFPKGTYLSSNLSIVGSNLEFDFNGSTLKASTLTTTFIDVTGSNLYFHDFVFDGNQNIQKGISIHTTSSNIRIENGTIKNIFSTSTQPGSFGISSGIANDLYIRNITFTSIHSTANGTTGDAYGLARALDISCDNTTYNKFYIGHCIFDDIHSLNTGSYPDEDAEAISLSNWNNTDQVIINGIIEHNQFKVCGKRFIKLMLVDGVTIRNNTGKDFPNPMYTLISAYCCKNLNIEKNNFYGIQAWAAIDLERSTAYTLAHDNIVVEKNRLVMSPNYTTQNSSFTSLVRLYDTSKRTTGQNANVKINKNILDGGSVGVYVDYSYQVSIDGNVRLNGYNPDILVTGYSDKIAVVENNILTKTNSTPSIQIGGGWLASESITEFTIRGNLMHSPQYGIYSTNATYGTVNENIGNCTLDTVSIANASANFIQIYGNYNERSNATQIPHNLIGDFSTSGKLSGGSLSSNQSITGQILRNYIGSFTTTNGTANQKLDLFFTGAFQGYFDIAITSGWSSGNATGKVSKRFSFNGTAGGSISYQETAYTDTNGALINQIAISDVTWDSTNSRWKIQLVQIPNTIGDTFQVYVEAFCADSTSLTNLQDLALSSIYTTDSTVFTSPVRTLIGATNFKGARQLPISTQTTNYTVGNSDDTVLVNATSSAITITLPNCTPIQGRVYTIKKTDSSVNAVTVATSSSQLIDGATTKVLSSQWQSIRIQSDGAGWQVI